VLTSRITHHASRITHHASRITPAERVVSQLNPGTVLAQSGDCENVVPFAFSGEYG
jgi:hypothetical protein